MGLLEDIIAQPAKARPAYKADLLCKATTAVLEKDVYKFSSGDYSFVISKPQLVKGGFSVNVEATFKGEPLKLSNPFEFYNPPVVVLDGEKVSADPLLALQAMVSDAVKTVTR